MSGVAIPRLDLARIIIVGLAATLVASLLSLPFLHRSVQPSELRYE